MSFNSSEEKRILRYPIAGQLPASDGPFVASYLNNSSSGKLESYVSTNTTYRILSCGPTRQIQISVQISNHAPRGLPTYVTVREDHPSYRVESGQVREILAVYLTNGARVELAKLDGRAVDDATGNPTVGPLLTDMTERGHPVAEIAFELYPGRTRTLTLSVVEPHSVQPVQVRRQALAGGAATHIVGSCR
jgi:hypothetical protein